MEDDHVRKLVGDTNRLLMEMKEEISQVRSDVAGLKAWSVASDSNQSLFWNRHWTTLESRVAQLEREIPRLATHTDMKRIESQMAHFGRLVWIGVGAAGVLGPVITSLVLRYLGV